MHGPATSPTNYGRPDRSHVRTEIGSARGSTALDGHQIGSLEVVEKVDGTFTELDQAVLVHIAEMASAAIERIHLYDA